MSNKFTKLIKYYSLINHNLIFSNKSTNRYQKSQSALKKNKYQDLKNLREKISEIKNCKLKENASNLVF